MTAAQAIAHFEQQVAAIGHLPHHLPLVTYATPEDLSCGQEKATVADLLNQRAVIDALTEHARGRGCVVVHVLFQPEAYRAWLKHRPDNRALRALWAAEQMPKL